MLHPTLPFRFASCFALSLSSGTFAQSVGQRKAQPPMYLYCLARHAGPLHPPSGRSSACSEVFDAGQTVFDTVASGNMRDASRGQNRSSLGEGLSCAVTVGNFRAFELQEGSIR